MKRGFLLLFILFVHQYVQAQNSLSGTITDSKDKSPLPGAIVSITDLKTGTTTDTTGHFEIKNIPKGNFLIEVKYIGYAAISRQVSVAGITVSDFQLSAVAIEQEGIIVTGVSGATEIKRAPAPVTIISKSELLQSTSANVIDALTHQPGINAVTTGQGISKPVIRGLGFNRVIVLNDGMRQEGQQWGDEHGIEIDEYSANKIEILKGPGSIMYGSDAIAGVINIISEDAVANKKITGSVFSNYQTNSGLIGYSASLAGNENGFVWRGRFSEKYAHAFHNAADGFVYNSNFHETDASVFLGLNKKWGYSHVNFSYYKNILGLPEGERDSVGSFIKQIALNDSTTIEEAASVADLKSYTPRIPYQLVSYKKISWMNTIYLGASKLYFNIGYSQSARKEFGEAQAPKDYGLYFFLQTIPFDLRWSFPPLKKINITVGVNGMYQQNENRGTEFLVPAYNLFDAGAFVFANRNFKKFSLSGGLRFDNRTVSTENLFLNTSGAPTDVHDSLTTLKFSSAKSNFEAGSGSAGLSYEVSKKIMMKLNAAHGFRAPNIAELGANGRHEGTFRYEIGNGELKSETSLQFDAGVSLNANYFSGGVSLFQNTISNFIFPQKLNSVFGGDSIYVDDGHSVPVYKFIQGHAALTGGEISIDIHPKPISWLHFETDFAFVQSVQKGETDSTKYLPFTPAPKLQSTVRAVSKKICHHMGNGFAEVGVVHLLAQNKIYSAYETETPTEAYTLLNVAAGADFISKDKTIFTLMVAVSNLTDVIYQDHLSRLKYAAQNPATGRTGIFNLGRNISMKMNFNFELKK